MAASGLRKKRHTPIDPPDFAIHDYGFLSSHALANEKPDNILI
jgi:hypothetical protein